MSESVFIKRGIADYIIAALAACHDLDSVQLFIRGVAPTPVRIDQYPYTEIVILEEAIEPRRRGVESGQIYRGQITVYTALSQIAGGDFLTPTGDRTARLQSYDAVEELVFYIRNELAREEHANLGGLVIGDESVSLFVLTGPFEYGMGPGERNDNYENYGALPFEVRTEKVQ